MRGLIFSLALLLPLTALAQGVPTPGVLDPRIQTIAYDPNQVVLLEGTLNYQFMLEFETGEKIETVSIGDALGWQVTPNRKANVLFIKPIDRSSATNLTILTDSRRYMFELRLAPAGSTAPVLYAARMAYPQPVIVLPDPPLPEPPEPPPLVLNDRYVITGSADGRPARIFDDGEMTYFEWPPGAATPGIFALAQDGTESLVDYVVRGPHVIVTRLSPRFLLRNGQQVVTVVNQGAGLPQDLSAVRTSR